MTFARHVIEPVFAEPPNQSAMVDRVEFLPSPSCSFCTAAARDAALERARRVAAERVAANADHMRQMREAVLGAALLAAPRNDANTKIMIADLKTRLAAAEQALEAAASARDTAQAALTQIETKWWYRLFHRGGGKK